MRLDNTLRRLDNGGLVDLGVGSLACKDGAADDMVGAASCNYIRHHSSSEAPAGTGCRWCGGQGEDRDGGI